MSGKQFWRGVVGYGGALAAVGIAVLLTHLLRSLGDSGISPLFFAAVLICAWFGGLRAGLAATALSGLATAYLLIPRINSLTGARNVVLHVLVFTVVAVLTSSLNEATRRAAEASRRAADALHKAKKAAEDASEAKTRFLATVSHELRTPLSSVVMVAGAIESDGSLPQAVRKDAAAILRSVEVEVRLIDDLVDLARLGSGKLSLAMTPLDLHEPLLAALHLCEADIRDKQLELALDLSAQRRGVVGDPVRLQQIFWNLIRNAIKFTPDQGRLTVRTFDDAGGQVIVEVSDSGIGIDSERLSSIFQAFEQGGPDIAARFGGLGLGLAICQALAEAHGGTIRAASAGIDQGAVFTASFPLAPQDHVGEASSSGAVTTAKPLAQGADSSR